MSHTKVYEVMNDLDMLVSKVQSIKSVVSAANDKIAENEYNESEELLYAACDLIDWFAETFDAKFRLAWSETLRVSREYDIMKDKELFDSVKEVKSWTVPVEIDDASGDCFITFPDDLMKITKWKTDDVVEWIDNKDGSYTLKKVEK